MSEELETFQDFRQEILCAATSNRDFQLNEFLLAFGRELEEAGEIETITPSFYETRRMRVDAYAFNDDEGIDLFIADFASRDTLEAIFQAEVATLVNRLTAFYKKAIAENLYRGFDEATEHYSLARILAEQAGKFGRLRFYVLSERRLSDRYKNIDVSADGGNRPITLHIWDIGRLNRLRSSRSQKESIEIDFMELCQQTVPCLPAHNGGSYSSYLLAMPGNVLADLYKQYSSRLMEQNVRAFLQATNSSNKGIRETILREPEMFFAYNNGITATASSIDLEQKDGIPHIRRIVDLQIVNGGQTTASLFHARRQTGADLSKIFVQTKLSIIDEAPIESVVPRISQYANTQSRINAADFFSNHPFHIRMQEFSRRIWAPAKAGEQFETHWFYERARGQFADEQSRLTSAEKKTFLRQFPRAQLIKKTDLAKYENAWDDHPRYVNLGSEKNFAQFARRIGKEWESSPDTFDEQWFRRMICRAILFRQLESIVSDQPWYNGGYRANIVAYTLAFLARLSNEGHFGVDTDRIWKTQNIDDPLRKILPGIAKVTHEELSGGGRGVSNITEWAKRPECWAKMLERSNDVRKLVS